MKLNYFPDTKSLYIKLAESPSYESEEIVDGIVVDFNKEGKVVGLDIYDASGFDMSRLEADGFDVPITQRNQQAIDEPANGQPAVLTARP